jgi:cell division protein FtsB
MPNEKPQAEKKASDAAHDPMPRRALDWSVRMWRPAASLLALVLAMLLGWHVVSGKHGLSVWRQKHAEDLQLRKEILSLQQENARLRQRVDRLNSDPDAIQHEARESLHYAKPNEVIVKLPPEPKTQTPPADPGKKAGSWLEFLRHLLPNSNS